MGEEKIVHKKSGQCLTISGDKYPKVPDPDNPETRIVVLKKCEENNEQQEWEWFWQKSALRKAS